MSALWDCSGQEEDAVAAQDAREQISRVIGNGCSKQEKLAAVASLKRSAERRGHTEAFEVPTGASARRRAFCVAAGRLG